MINKKKSNRGREKRQSDPLAANIQYWNLFATSSTWPRLGEWMDKRMSNAFFLVFSSVDKDGLTLSRSRKVGFVFLGLMDATSHPDLDQNTHSHTARDHRKKKDKGDMKIEGGCRLKERLLFRTHWIEWNGREVKIRIYDSIHSFTLSSCCWSFQWRVVDFIGVNPDGACWFHRRANGFKDRSTKKK